MPTAYKLSAPDNDRHMLRGDAEPPRCGSCGLITDLTWVDPAFTAPTEALDISFTFDNRPIASRAFRETCDDESAFVSVDARHDWSLVAPTQVVRFDSVRRRTRFEGRCEACGQYAAVAGARPVYLLDEVAPDALVRTDIAFGTSDERYPLILVGVALAERLRQAELSGLDLMPVEDSIDAQ